MGLDEAGPALEVMVAAIVAIAVIVIVIVAARRRLSGAPSTRPRRMVSAEPGAREDTVSGAARVIASEPRGDPGSGAAGESRGDGASGGAATALVLVGEGEAVSRVTTRRRGEGEAEGAPSEVEALLGGVARGFRRAHQGVSVAPIQVAPPTLEIDGGGEAVGMSWRGVRASASGRSQHEMSLVSVAALRREDGARAPRTVDLSALESSASGRGTEQNFGREVEDALSDFAAPRGQARSQEAGEGRG